MYRHLVEFLESFIRLLPEGARVEAEKAMPYLWKSVAIVDIEGSFARDGE